MSRHCIFEDNIRDDIQRLFALPYRYNIENAVELHWVEGAHNVEIKIREIYSSYGIDLTKVFNLPVIAKDMDTETKNSTNVELMRKLVKLYTNIEIYVFLDLVPDNPFTVKSYEKLLKLKRRGCNILVFPIPCSEYYMLKTLCSLHMEGLNQDIITVLNREVYYNSNLFELELSKEYITNFEKYCKVVFGSISKICARKSNNADREHNNLKGRFYRVNCEDCKECDFGETLQNKAEELLHRFPCIPIGANITKFHRRVLSRNEMVEIHRQLVDEYNATVERYRGYSGQMKVPIPELMKKLKTISYFE